LKLLAIEKKCASGMVRLRGWLTRPDAAGEVELYFAFPEELAPLVAEHADAFVPALLPPAMAHGTPLEIAPPVSRRLWSQLPRIQEILADWFPGALRSVPVHAGALRGASRAPTELTGAFFSLGVDSFHTLLRHERESESRERITHLIHMDGFERALHKTGDGRAAPVAETIRRVASHFGKQAICGETNLRDCFPLHWGAYYHGAGLASVGLALSGGLSRVLIPSSFAWRHVLPWASSPIVDPLWSSDDLEILHDGTGVDRARKVFDTILRHPEALQWLRVCHRNAGGAGNCGFCNKCVRTMVTLEIAGVLHESAAFPRPLPRDFWRYLEIKRSGVPFEEDNLRLARELGAPRWLVAGLERAVRVGRLEVLRQREGTLGLGRALLDLAWERSYGDAVQHLRARRLRTAHRAARGRSSRPQP
jgi:hypothetical protein